MSIRISRPLKEQTESIINLEFSLASGLQESFIHCLKLDFDFLSDLKLEEKQSTEAFLRNVSTTQFSNAMDLSNSQKKVKVKHGV